LRPGALANEDFKTQTPGELPRACSLWRITRPDCQRTKP